MERSTTAADEQSVVGRKPAAAREAMTESATGLSADWYHALSSALSHHATPTLNEVDVANSKIGGLTQPQTRVEQQQDDRPVTLGLLRTCIEGS